MNTDAELETWRRQWQAGATATGESAMRGAEHDIPPDLRMRVARQSRFMRIMLIGDILVTAGMGGATVAWAVVSREFDVVVLAAATWLFIAAAWAFRLTNTRGLWAPAALDASAYLNLSIRRCRASLASLRFGAVLYAVEIVFCLVWIYHNGRVQRPALRWLWFGSPAIDFVWLMTGAFIAFVFFYGRRKKAELWNLQRLEEDSAEQ